MGGLPRHIPSPAQAQPRGIPLGSGSGTSATRNVSRHYSSKISCN
jgi:hypothetical protein